MSYPHVPDDPTTIGDRMVNTAYEDRNGTIWFATPNGLNRYDRDSGRFTRYPHDPADPGAIPGGFVCGPLEDGQGNFWVLSDGFLTLFDREAGRSAVSYETFKSPITVIEDRTSPDRLWLCSWGEGLARFDKTTRTFTYFRHDPDDPDSLSNDLLVTIHQAEDGLIWAPLSASPDPDPAAPAAGGAETVLLVEDEPLVRRFAARALESRGYRVLVATDGEDALRILAEAEASVDLLLTDVVMPRMDGRELVRIALDRGFNGAVLYMSGYAESAIATDGVLASGVSLVKKPFLADDLARRVRQALDGAPA